MPSFIYNPFWDLWDFLIPFVKNSINGLILLFIVLFVLIITLFVIIKKGCF